MSSFDSLPGSAAASGVLVLSGYGINIRVERSHLVTEDGVGPERRRFRLSRIQPRLSRLTVLGTAGTVSLSALQWLQDVGMSFVQIGYDGEVITSSTPVGKTNPELVRAQALVSSGDAAVEVGRQFVLAKLEGSLAVLDRIEDSDDAQHHIRAEIERTLEANTGLDVLAAEAQAGQAYWKAWRGIPVRFSDPSRVPEHWLEVGPRTSPFRGGNHRAATPANAILNYLYTVLLAETRLACFAVGLDPGIGLYHATKRWHHSLAYDLMEPARAEVDDFVLDLLETRVFEHSDFFETRKGIVRVRPPLSHELAESADRWRRVVAPIVEGTALDLLKAGGKGQRGATARIMGSTSEGSYLSTPLTQARRKGRKQIRSLARSRTMRRQYHENRAWERANSDAGSDINFEKDVLPGLASVSVEAMRKATGLSLAYCSEIRKGGRIPHRRHWGALRRVGANARSDV